MLSSIRAVLFDLDGTLIDSAPDLIDTLNVLLSREGIAGLPYEEGRVLIGGGARRLIERGLGVSFLPASTIQTELHLGTLASIPIAEGHRVTLPTSAMVRKSSAPNPLAEAFIASTPVNAR